jgi:hypothetical protein
MRLAIISLLVAGMASLAAAEPVAEGYELVIENGELIVVKGKRRSPLTFGMFELSQLKVDKKARKVVVPALSDCEGDHTIAFTFDHFEARLFHAEGLAAHKKKDWANAAKAFASAVRFDPKWVELAYLLAAARTQLNDRAGATAALAPWLASAPVPTYLKVAHDPELSPLLATKELAAIRAPKPGTAKVDAAGIVGYYGFSAHRGIVAATVEHGPGRGCTATTVVVLFDVARGTQLGEMELSGREVCDDTVPADKRKPELVAPDRAKQIEKLLADFGVDPTPWEEAAGVGGEPYGPSVATLPKAGLGVGQGASGSEIRRGKTLVGTTQGGGRIELAGWVPAGKLIVTTNYHHSHSCGRTTFHAIPVRP